MIHNCTLIVVYTGHNHTLIVVYQLLTRSLHSKTLWLSIHHTQFPDHYLNPHYHASAQRVCVFTSQWIQLHHKQIFYICLWYAHPCSYMEAVSLQMKFTLLNALCTKISWIPIHQWCDSQFSDIVIIKWNKKISKHCSCHCKRIDGYIF